MKKALLFLIALCLMAVGYVAIVLKPMPPAILLGELAAKPLVHNTDPLPENTSITRLLVFKSQRQMWAYHQDQLVKIYPISLGKQPIGHKQFEGDQKTPEGIYQINERNPNSCCHKNLGISYPNQQDREFAKSQGKSAGGLIKIHGLPEPWGWIGRQHLRKDWTDGCIGVTDDEVDELFNAVIPNAEIEIRP